MSPRSTAELTLEAQLSQAGIPFRREFAFAAPRRYRADFLVTPPAGQGWHLALLIEVEGAVWVNGRHVRGAGFESGCEKQALAVIAGYRYLRVTSKQVESGQALEWIRAALHFSEQGAAA